MIRSLTYVDHAPSTLKSNLAKPTEKYIVQISYATRIKIVSNYNKYFIS